jgi:hypothetical protein
VPLTTKKERQGSRATRCRSVGNRVQCPYQSTSEVPRRCRKAFQIRPESNTCALSKQKIETRPSIRGGKNHSREKTQKDREDFSKLLGRRLKTSTKSASQGPAKFDTERKFRQRFPSLTLPVCVSIYPSVCLSDCDKN